MRVVSDENGRVRLYDMKVWTSFSPSTLKKRMNDGQGNKQFYRWIDGPNKPCLRELAGPKKPESTGARSSNTVPARRH